MTVREYLQFVARIKGVAPSDRKARVEQVMARTWVADMAGRACGKLSKGYRQRVGLAQALIHNPDVLILDEPTAGLDPKQIIETRRLIKELAGDHTIILSTHILPEVSQTCDRVVIINKGRVVAVDTPANLTGRLRGARRCSCRWRRRAGEAAAALAKVPGVVRVAPVDGRRRAHSRWKARRDATCVANSPGPSSRRTRPARAAADAREPRRHLPLADDRGTARGGRVMSNALAIANKELRSYFASPIAYIVIGFFALLFGWFYIGILDWFVRQGMQMGPAGMGQSNMNVNQQMVRPLLLNMTVVFLFLLPLITMRTYAEEKRSGTIELLLTSPLTDVEIVAGKFLGAMGLYASMLAVSLLHFGLLFAFGTPEWKPLVTSYVGLLLFGGCFISVGLFISSLTKNQIVAGAATFGVFLLLWVIDWIGQGMGPRAEAVLKYLSMTEHLDDFVKGVVDTKHLVYYLSFITFGLFLTVKSVDSERWRG